MKYILIPIWRVIMALFVFSGQMLCCFVWLIVFLYHLRVTDYINLKKHPNFFWYHIEDGYGTIRSMYPKGTPPQYYYRNPWDALINKRSTL